ncbi:plasma membrane fusion protein [Physcia stellaris]|nr:plasma membrane fusion protein [Physcia stellaris]
MSTQQDSNPYYLEKHIESLKNAALNASNMAWNDPYGFHLGEIPPIEAELEPPPLIPYGILYSRVKSVVQHLPQEDKKDFLRPYDDLAQSRDSYHVIHRKIKDAYFMLQDARAFHTIMLEKKAKVETRIAELEAAEGLEEVLRQKRTEMQTVIMQIDQNAQEVPDLLAKTRDLTHRRDEVCSTFITMKKEILASRIPLLRNLYEQIRQKQQEQQKVLALQSLPPTPVSAE